MTNSTDTKTPNKSGIFKVAARLVTTGLISFGIGGAVTFDRYNNYWNQTIFRVQTVDFNILSHTLPTKLSYALIKKEPKEVQRTLNSNYNLFGLIVTDSSGKEIIAYSGKDSGKSSSRKTALSPQELQNYPYDVLLDPPPVFAQWTYSKPQSTERSATSFTNQGRVIGRVYYVRGVRPTFQEDLIKWLSNPFSESSRIQTYTTSLAACFGATLLIWSGLEFMLYKKRIDQQNAQYNLALADERRNSELAIADEKRLSDLAIAEEKARRESELAEQKRLRDLEEIEKENRRQQQELIDDNQSLQVQLTERIYDLQLLQKQREDERNKLTNDANNLSIVNTRLQEEIGKLKTSLNNLSTNTDSVDLQSELDKTKSQSQQNLIRQKQYEESIHKLNQQLQVIYNKHLEANEKNENELSQLQQQKQDAESDLKQLRNNEENSQRIITTLELQLNNQRLVQEQLKNQLDILQSSLSESQQREQQLEKRAKQARDQSEDLAEEMERYIEETGKHPLNDFEVAIKESLEHNFSDARIEIQFDVASGRQRSKVTDFILMINSCCIILEAKSYKGVIKPLGDIRNAGWICQKGNKLLNIYSCWGKNPYKQVKTYCDSAMSNRSLIIQSKKPVYGVVVFPKGSCIDDSIKSNIDDCYRVITLDNLSTVIQELDNQAMSRN